MNAIIDTSSLMALVRYYLPFDRDNKLKKLLQTKFENRELIVIDEVMAESQLLQKGIILKEFDFITLKSNRIIKTDTLVPDRKFFNRLENDFCNHVRRTSARPWWRHAPPARATRPRARRPNRRGRRPRCSRTGSLPARR